MALTRRRAQQLTPSPEDAMTILSKLLALSTHLGILRALLYAFVPFLNSPFKSQAKHLSVSVSGSLINQFLTATSKR